MTRETHIPGVAVLWPAFHHELVPALLEDPAILVAELDLERNDAAVGFGAGRLLAGDADDGLDSVTDEDRTDEVPGPVQRGDGVNLEVRAVLEAVGDGQPQQSVSDAAAELGFPGERFVRVQLEKVHREAGELQNVPVGDGHPGAFVLLADLDFVEVTLGHGGVMVTQLGFPGGWLSTSTSTAERGLPLRLIQGCGHAWTCSRASHWDE